MITVRTRTGEIGESRLDAQRTAAFSDGVIAIAMTLLAIELPLPHGETPARVWASFAQNFGDEYLAFLISFAVIAMFWFQHHRLFARIERISPELTLWNLLGLLAIVLIPFATRMLSADAVELPPGEQDRYSLGPVFYATIMLLWGAAFVLMVGAASRGRLWRAETPPSAPRNIVYGTCAALAMFAVSIPIAFVNPSLAQLSWLLIPVVSIAEGRVHRKEAKS